MKKSEKQIARDEWNKITGVHRRGGITAGLKTAKNKTGFHNPKIQKKAAILGGHASIDKLQQWQKDNNHLEKLNKLERTDEWKSKIGDGNRGKVRSKELIQRISNTIKENNSKLTNEERSKKFSNDSASRKSLKIRTEILNLIENDRFTTSEARKVCDDYGLGNWKAFLKDTRIIKQIHKGTNNYNPSIYEKIK